MLLMCDTLPLPSWSGISRLVMTASTMLTAGLLTRTQGSCKNISYAIRKYLDSTTLTIR